MLKTLRTGDWLTPERLRVYPRVLLALTAVAVLVWIAFADGLIDRNGKPLGTDFSNVWAAGRLTLDGHPEHAYDPARQHAAEKEAFGGRDVPFYGWHYPPLFLAVAAGLALLPYGWALFAWMALTLPLYLATIRSIVRDRAVLAPALAFPAVLINLAHGQNGFLTAALLGSGLMLLHRRPLVAGILFGLLAYKPQFGLLLPLVLAVAGCWGAFAAAAATVIAASALAFAAFGVETWTAFHDSLAFTQGVVLEAGGTGWQKIQSLFSAVRMWGGGVEMAYAAQSALALAVAGALVWLWRSSAAHALKAAALAGGVLLVTPYVLDYDMVVLAVAIAFFASHGLVHGFRAYEKTILATAWLAPLVARSLADATAVPVGFLSILALFALTLRRAAQEVGERAPSSGRRSLAQA